jgi:hypothetical protein
MSTTPLIVTGAKGDSLSYDQALNLLAWDGLTIDEFRTALGLEPLSRNLGNCTVSEHRARVENMY